MTLGTLTGLLLITGWTYYEMVIEHPTVAIVLAAEGHSAQEEFGEILLYGGLPALVLALVGGWFLMRQALAPMTGLAHTVESIGADTLGQQLPRSGNGDEIDRLAEVFNSMLKRLDSSFSNIRDFTISASHELKTPLTIMRGEIETRLREPSTRLRCCSAAFANFPTGTAPTTCRGRFAPWSFRWSTVGR